MDPCDCGLAPQSAARPVKSASLPRSTSHPSREAGDRVDYHYATVSKPRSETSVYDNCRGTVLRRAHSESPSAGNTPQRKSMPSILSARDSPSKRIHDTVRPASAIAEITAQRLESPKRVVIGDVITTSRTSSPVSLTNEKPNGILKKDTSMGGDRCLPALHKSVSVDAENMQHEISVTCVTDSVDADRVGSPSGKKSHLTVDTTLTPGNSRHTSSSESPEWPSPPEPLTPQTPTTPLGQLEFDSDTIKRLLRSLPSSPVDKEDYDLGFHDDPNLSSQGRGQGRRGSSLSRTKSLNTDDRARPRGGSSVRGRLNQEPMASAHVVCKSMKVNRSRMFNKVALEEELRKRNRCVVAVAAAVASYQGSYPDSGIGMPGDTTGSLPSEGSGKSRTSRKGRKTVIIFA